MSIIQAVSFLRYTVAVFIDVCTGITHLTSEILHLKENVDTLYESVRVLASHKGNPLIVPRVDIFNILVKVKHDMRTNNRLELPDDPDRNIRAYILITKVAPVVRDDLSVILAIPFIDGSLQIDL